MRRGSSGVYASVGGNMGYLVCILDKTQMNGRYAGRDGGTDGGTDGGAPAHVGIEGADGTDRQGPGKSTATAALIQKALADQGVVTSAPSSGTSR